MASGLGPWLAADTHILRQNPHFGRSAHSKFFVWEILNRIWIPNACTNSGSDQTPHRTLESRIPKSIHILVSDQTPSERCRFAGEGRENDEWTALTPTGVSFLSNRGGVVRIGKELLGIGKRLSSIIVSNHTSYECRRGSANNLHADGDFSGRIQG